ncbi:MAG: peptidoglycan-associated lipoprotein Pal [Verrucomicrobia bacterium]|nr:peptidoglycan-associated lipoprotein Pal [Verrucomicrobiota bacterium]
MNSVTKLLAVAISLTIFCVGCFPKKHKGLTPIPGSSRASPPTDQNPRPGELGGPAVPDDPRAGRTPIPDGELPPRGETRDNYNVDRETFKQSTVYFEFDSSAVRANEKAKVDAVAAYLKNEPAFKLEVEGHCDERGTPEYNRALGERRALSVREALVALGIAPERVSTISFGEDKPAVLGSDESAWAKNRRAEFILLKPKAAAQ